MAHLQALEQMQKIEIREKASGIEALHAIIGSEFEVANKCEVSDGTGGAPVFCAVEKTVAEETDCCTRWLRSCFPGCTPWNVDVIYLPTEQLAYTFKKRPCTLPWCCFDRPVMEVVDEIRGTKIGSVVDPCACCGLTFSIRDPDDEVVLKANGGCCHPGMLCPLPCDPRANVEFHLEDAKSGQEVGGITKKVPSSTSNNIPDDNYHVDFGGVQNPDFKPLVMALGMFMDFRYFRR